MPTDASPSSSNGRNVSRAVCSSHLISHGVESTAGVSAPAKSINGAGSTLKVSLPVSPL